MKLGLELRLLDSKKGFRMLENLEKHIEFLKLGGLCQWEKLLLNYASIMNDMNNKRNCGIYRSKKKIQIEVLESLHIYIYI